MSHWEYRLVITATSQQERDVDICEVYFDDAGTAQGYTARPPGTTLWPDGHFTPDAELRSVLAQMGLALQRTVLHVVDGKITDTGKLVDQLKDAD